MPIYIESRNLDAIGGSVAEHQYLVYIPDGQELNYDAWQYSGAFPDDRNVRDGSLLTGLVTTNILFKLAADDRWTIDDFSFVPDVIAVAAVLGKSTDDVTFSDMVAEGYAGTAEAFRHRELVNDGSSQGEADLWGFLAAKANDISGQFTYKAENLIDFSNKVLGPAVNSNSFISSILRHAQAEGYSISAFNTDANVVGSDTWLGTKGDDTLDGRISFVNGHDAINLYGGEGADTLMAGTNKSYLVAGKDQVRDTLIGNSGDDT